MIDILYYFWPDKPLPQALVVALVILFAHWLWRLTKLTAAVRRGRAILSVFAEEADTLRTGEGAQAGQRLDEFCREKSLPVEHPITEHVRAIVIAGERESRLDVPELTQRTIAVILRDESALRIRLSLFVVLGLLGTLFGLADAVGAFVTPGRVEQVRTQLLSGLKGAFAPSITGVLFSIAGGLLYSWFHARVASRFAADLRLVTTRDLVPALLPTYSQRAAEQAERMLEASGRVLEFAESIEEKTATLNRSIDAAAQCARQIEASMTAMNGAVSAASTTVDGTLTKLGERIDAFSSALAGWTRFESKIDEFQAALTTAQQKQADVMEQVRTTAAELAATSAEIHSGLTGGLERLTHAVAELGAPVERTAVELKAVTGEFTAAVKELVIDAKQGAGELSTSLAGAHREELQAVTGFFEKLEADWLSKMDLAIRAIDGLKEPFERAAANLQSQGELTTGKMERMLLDLISILRTMSEGLQRPPVQAPPPAPPELHLSEADRAFLLGMVRELAPRSSDQSILEMQRALTAKLDRMIAVLQARLAGVGRESGEHTAVVTGPGAHIATLRAPE
jgi:hypothetical protein